MVGHSRTTLAIQNLLATTHTYTKSFTAPSDISYILSGVK